MHLTNHCRSKGFVIFSQGITLVFLTRILPVNRYTHTGCTIYLLDILETQFFCRHEAAIGNVRCVRIKYVQMHFTKPRISYVYQRRGSMRIFTHASIPTVWQASQLCELVYLFISVCRYGISCELLQFVINASVSRRFFLSHHCIEINCDEAPFA